MKRAIPIIVMSFASCAARADKPPPALVRLSDVAPTIIEDMRYAGPDNFTGRPVPGYGAPHCRLAREAAHALGRAQQAAQREGLSLIVWDCYRPQVATDAFMRWTREGDDATKARHYPRVARQDLVPQGYIAAQSGHSRGASVDVGLARNGAPLDFGGPFDLFDPTSATQAPDVPAMARATRRRLEKLMRAHGFVNYKREWWHYSFVGAATRRPLDVETR